MNGEEDKKTRQAVALRYDPERAAAPQVVASGRNEVAQRIVATAREHGVHVHEDPELAGLLEQLPLEQEIPEEFYTVVAELLAFVYRVEKSVG